jgi:hypothetical protein
MLRNCGEGLRLVIFHSFESLAITLITALLPSAGGNVEMSLTYKSTRIPSLEGYMLQLA